MFSLKYYLGEISKEKTMKNLRRILVAVAILLLVACSVGLVAAAADQYTGTVSGLENEYKKVERDRTNIGKSEKLEAVYTYLAQTPVDPLRRDTRLLSLR